MTRATQLLWTIPSQLPPDGGGGTAAVDRSISAAPLPADGKGDTAAAGCPISAALLPPDGKGGTAAVDHPIGMPDNVLAL